MESMQACDQSQARIFIPGVESALRVLGFHGQIERFDAPYQYWVEIASQEALGLPSMSVLSRRLVRLTWTCADGETGVSGFIAQMQDLGCIHHQYRYRFLLCSPWCLLKEARRYQSWVMVSPVAIIHSLVQSVMPCAFQWRALLRQPVGDYPQCLQYDLSHWQMVMLLCRKFGLLPWVNSQDGIMQMGVTDDVRLLASLSDPVALHFQDPHAHAHEDEVSYFQWKRVVGKDETLLVESNCRAFQLGQRVRLEDRDEDYRVVALEQSLQQDDTLNQALRFYSRATLIPAASDCKLSFDPEDPCLKKTLYLPAKLVATQYNDGYPDVDAAGSYRAKYFFDDASGDDHTPPLKTLMPCGGVSEAQSGAAHGWHFGLRPGTDVILFLLDGIFHPPIIAGVLAHPEQQAPVTHKNPTEHRMRTWGGHELVFHDDPRSPFIRLNTKDQAQRLMLDATLNKEKLDLKNQTGRVNHYSQQDFFIQAKQQRVTVQGEYVIDAASSQCFTDAGDMTIKTPAKIDYASGAAMRWQTKSGDIVFKHKKHVSQVSEALQCLAKEGDLCFEASSGCLGLSAMKLYGYGERILLGGGGVIQAGGVSFNGGVLKAVCIDVFGVVY